MARAELGPYAAIAVLVLGAGGLIATLTTILSPGVQPTEPASAPPPPPKPAPPPPLPPPPPLTFAEPENAPLLPEVEAALARIRTQLAKDPNAARATCTAIAPKLAKLVPEQHPRIRGVVDGTKRACEAEVPAAALDRVLDQKPSKAKCREAMRLVDQLKAWHDDPKVSATLARFGALCAS